MSTRLPVPSADVLMRSNTTINTRQHRSSLRVLNWHFSTMDENILKSAALHMHHLFMFTESADAHQARVTQMPQAEAYAHHQSPQGFKAAVALTALCLSTCQPCAHPHTSIRCRNSLQSRTGSCVCRRSSVNLVPAEEMATGSMGRTQHIPAKEEGRVVKSPHSLPYPGTGRTQHIPAKGTARALDHAEHVRLGAHGRLDYLVQQDELVQGGDWNRSAPAANLSQRPAKDSSLAKRMSFPWCGASQIQTALACTRMGASARARRNYTLPSRQRRCTGAACGRGSAFLAVQASVRAYTTA